MQVAPVEYNHSIYIYSLTAYLQGQEEQGLYFSGVKPPQWYNLISAMKKACNLLDSNP